MGRKTKGLKIRRSGRLPDEEKLAIALIHDMNPEASAAAIAKILGRATAPIHNYIRQAQQILQVHAPWYASKHIEATNVASAKGDAGPAQWALERLTAVCEDGSEIRVIERDTSQAVGNAGLTVNIGLQVGNIPRAISGSASPASLPIEGTLLPASDSSDKT